MYQPRPEGDGRLVAFDSALPAVETAAALQRAFHDERWAESAAVRVRIGLHTGDVPRSPDGSPHGITLHEGARIGSVAHGGQTVLSSTTAAMVTTRRLPSGLSLRALPLVNVRNFGEQQLWHSTSSVSSQSFLRYEAMHRHLRTSSACKKRLRDNDDGLIGWHWHPLIKPDRPDRTPMFAFAMSRMD